MSAEPMCSPSHLDGHMFVGDADVCRCGAARLVPADPAPPVSETAAWTEQDERDVQTFALRGFDAVIGTAQNVRWAREILRLRAERIEHLARLVGYAREIDSLRSELAAATRERETPPDDSPNSLGVQLAALEARDFQRINDPRATPIPPAPAEGGFERVGDLGIRPCRGHWHVTCLNDDGTEGDDIAIRGDPFRDRDAAYRAALAENPSQR